MTEAVFDSSVIVAGCGWRGEAHLCLVAMARRRVRVFTSDWILDEARRAIVEAGTPKMIPFLALHSVARRRKAYKVQQQNQ